MKTCKVWLQGTTPYSQSKHYDVEREERETPKDYEARTWRNRMHVDENGEVYAPPLCFKNALSSIAKFLGEQVPGRGKKTYTKSFESGILITEPLALGIKANEVPGEWLFVPADGIRGSGKRVDKCFPCIQKWEGELTVHVLDDLITKEVFERHLKQAGNFIGIGRFRPERNGFYGRFIVKKIQWEGER